MNEYIVNKSQQIAIKADSPEDAVQKVMRGEGTSAGMSINVSLRPQRQPNQPNA